MIYNDTFATRGGPKVQKHFKKTRFTKQKDSRKTIKFDNLIKLKKQCWPKNKFTEKCVEKYQKISSCAIVGNLFSLSDQRISI